MYETTVSLSPHQHSTFIQPWAHSFLRLTAKNAHLHVGAYSYQKPKICKHQKALNYITENVALIIIIVTSQISRNHYTTEPQFLKIEPTFNWVSGGPTRQRKSSKEMVVVRRNQLLAVQIKFIWEKPLSHSAL